MVHQPLKPPLRQTLEAHPGLSPRPKLDTPKLSNPRKHTGNLYGATMNQWISAILQDSVQPCWRPKSALRVLRITWSVRKGLKQLHIWNLWPQLSYSLHNFYGTTMTIKGSLLVKISYGQFFVEIFVPLWAKFPSPLLGSLWLPRKTSAYHYYQHNIGSPWP